MLQSGQTFIIHLNQSTRLKRLNDITSTETPSKLPLPTIFVCCTIFCIQRLRMSFSLEATLDAQGTQLMEYVGEAVFLFIPKKDHHSKSFLSFCNTIVCLFFTILLSWTLICSYFHQPVESKIVSCTNWPFSIVKFLFVWHHWSWVWLIHKVAFGSVVTQIFSILVESFHLFHIHIQFVHDPYLSFKHNPSLFIPISVHFLLLQML